MGLQVTVIIGTDIRGNIDKKVIKNMADIFLVGEYLSVFI